MTLLRPYCCLLALIMAVLPDVFSAAIWAVSVSGDALISRYGCSHFIGERCSHETFNLVCCHECVAEGLMLLIKIQSRLNIKQVAARSASGESLIAAEFRIQVKSRVALFFCAFSSAPDPWWRLATLNCSDLLASSCL